MQPRSRTFVGALTASILATVLVASPPALAASGAFTQSAPIVADGSGLSTIIAASTDQVTPDADGESSTLMLPAPPTAQVTRLEVVLDVDHDSLDDLDVVLSAPDGRTTVLVSDVGGAHAFQDSLIVRDSTKSVAVMPFGDDNIIVPMGTATDHDTTSGDVDAFPGSGVTSLAALSGSDAQGDWTLTAYDDTAGNVGSLPRWQIRVDYGISATPSPSTVFVSGLPTAVTDVDLALRDLDTDFLADTEILLESPDGRYAHVLSDAGGGPAADLGLTLDDEAGADVPEWPAAGRFRPRNYDSPGDISEPIGGVETVAMDARLSVFDGGRADGTWRLWVFQECCGSSVHIGSWSLKITTADPPGAPPAPVPVADTAAPVLSNVELTPKRLPTGVGARLRVASTEPARLVGVVQRRRNGEWTRAGTKSWTVRGGANTRKFYGRTAQARLRSGRYRVLFVATDAAGNASAEVRRRFQVDRG